MSLLLEMQAEARQTQDENPNEAELAELANAEQKQARARNAFGLEEPEVEPGFNGGARESANWDLDPERSFDESTVDLAQRAKQKKYGA